MHYKGPQEGLKIREGAMVCPLVGIGLTDFKKWEGGGAVPLPLQYLGPWYVTAQSHSFSVYVEKVQFCIVLLE